MASPPPKRALITGATSGIGLATAKLLARDGMEIGVLAEDPLQVEETVHALRWAGGKAFPADADLSRREQVAGLIDRLESRSGPVDILVNSAGIGLQADVAETSEADLRLLFEVNFLAMALLSRDAFRRMAERGGGHIINVSSAGARRALPGLGIYAATKAAMHAFSQALRVEGKAAGVHVTEILPMSVRTPFFRNARNHAARPYEAGFWSTSPERVAACILRAIRHPVPEVYTSLLSRFALSVDAMNPRWLDAVLAALHQRQGF